MFITIVLIPILKGVGVKVNAIDMPNPRKVHTAPIPKVGGVAMALGTLVPVLLWLPSTPQVRSILIGAAIIVVAGVVDDVKELGYKTKFSAQVIAALIIIFYGKITISNLGVLLPEGYMLSSVISAILTLLVIVGVTNAINLSDGLDGLAGGITLLTFVCIGYLAFRSENHAITIIALASADAIFGFLRFNTHPATVFMGDAGSQFLGFIAIVLSIAITQENTPVSPFLPLIILGFPVLDTLTVMTERIANGRSPFVADKNHFHHKLMRLGMYHTEAVFGIYVLQTALVTTAILFRYHSDWLFVLLFIGFAAVISVGFLYAKRTGWRIKRYDVIDRVIKGRLLILKEKRITIRFSYSILRYGLPVLVVVTCFVPETLPAYFSAIALQLIGALSVALLFKPGWMSGVLRLSLYLLVPYMIYFSQVDPSPLFEEITVRRLYILFSGAVIFFAVMTLKFTLRRKGFKATPMDFLILFIALVVPNLPGLGIEGHRLGLMAAQIIVILFSYEVLIGELRNELKGLGLATIVALGVMAVRGLI